MESKNKSGTKPTTKTEKKEPAPHPKHNPGPAEPEQPAPDGDQVGEQEGNEAAGGCCENLENLKPFFIAGAVVALGAVLVGLFVLAKNK